MNLNRALLTIFFFVFFLKIGVAQKGTEQHIKIINLRHPDKFNWSPVDSADLRMTTYSLDTTAEAVVLSDNGYYQVGYSFIFFRNRRVKLLKKSAFTEYGNLKIVYNEKEQTFGDFYARVIQPDGTTIELDATNIFEEKLNNRMRVKKVIFPQLQEGSIIEYAYGCEIANSILLPKWYFQEAIPIKHSSLTLYILEQFKYVYFTQGTFRPKALIDTSSINPRFTLSVDSIPALHEDNYITTMSDYYTTTQFQLTGYKADEYTKTKSFYATWAETEKNLTKLESLGEQYTKSSNSKKLWRAVEPLLDTVKTAEAKVKIIYNFINKNVIWRDDDFEFNADVDKLDIAFEKGKANSAELNLMLIALLRKADIMAHPVLISTRDHGAPIDQHPILDQFNHTLCYLELDGKPLILDAGNPHRPLGCLRVPSLNGKGWLMEKDKPRWIDIKAPLSTERVLANISLSEDGTLMGEVTLSLQGYAGVAERDKVENDSTFKYLTKSWTENFPDAKIEKVAVKNFKNPEEALKMSYKVTIPNGATVANDLMYFKPTFKSDFDVNPLKSKERSFPVDLPYPIRDEYTLALEIPKGYIVEEKPAPKVIKLGESDARFQYIVEEQNGFLRLISRIHIQKTYYLPSEYAAIKDFFKTIADKHAEQIILKKK